MDTSSKCWYTVVQIETVSDTIFSGDLLFCLFGGLRKQPFDQVVLCSEWCHHFLLDESGTKKG